MWSNKTNSLRLLSPNIHSDVALFVPAVAAVKGLRPLSIGTSPADYSSHTNCANTAAPDVMMNATTGADGMPNISPTSGGLVGWVSKSSGRGTLSLITTCLVTIFLCTWVVIHPRVYETETYAMWHKIVLFLKAIFAPELIAVEGLQEWAQCRRMVRDCATLTKGNFKLVHAFYFSMLALGYRTPQGNRVIWPNQHTWLLRQGYISWEGQSSWELSVQQIREKSKADSATKLISLIRVSWFVAQSIMRTASALPLSPLESMTLSYIPLFAVTYFFWWYEAKDMTTPTIVDLPHMCPEQKHIFELMSVSKKFDNEGMEEQTTYWIWYLTPHVFEKEAEDQTLRYMEKAAQMAAKKLRCAQDNNKVLGVKLGIDACESGSENRDSEIQPVTLTKESVVSHWDPGLYRSKIWPAICLFGASFGALHLISWHTVFPTMIDLWLWHISTFFSVFSVIVFTQFEKVIVRWGGLLIITSLLSPILYLGSRLVLMSQDFAAFRASDPAIYETDEV